MADILISGLTAAASLAGTDVLEIDTGTLSRKVTGAQVATYVLGTRTVATNNGLTGGGVLSSNLTIGLDLPNYPIGGGDLPNDLFLIYNTLLTQYQQASWADITSSLGVVTPTNSGLTSTGGNGFDAQIDLEVNFFNLVADANPASGDLFAFRDISAGTTDKITFTQLQTALNAGYTASRVLETSGAGALQVSAVTTTELAVLDGITTTTAELNVLDGSTATTADLNEIAGLATFDQGLRQYFVNQTISTTGAITLGTTHQNSFLYMTNASTTTFTIPPNSTTAFNVGTEIEFWRSDASVVIVEGSGVTLNGHDGTANVTTTATLGTQHTGCCIKKVATDTWVVFGSHVSS